MSFHCKGKKYRSKKHPMLEEIFFKKNPNRSNVNRIIDFTLKDISEAYQTCGIPEPASISNTILDLTRKDNGINSRVPPSISSLGFDLQKRTGPTGLGGNYAGEFVYVGVGNELKTWLKWPIEIEAQTISSAPIPKEVLPLIRPDEGGLFSVIDYCDLLSIVVYGKANSVNRVQNPMKWQPNEVDGFYLAKIENKIIYHPTEAKALTTGDEINLVQLQGEYDTVIRKLVKTKLQSQMIKVIPLAVRMKTNSINIAIFSVDSNGKIGSAKFKRVVFKPPIPSWN